MNQQVISRLIITQSEDLLDQYSLEQFFFMIYVTLVNRFEDKNVNAFPPQYQIFKNRF
jgi:hypothetical protein